MTAPPKQKTPSRGRRVVKLTIEQILVTPWDRLPAILSLTEAATRCRLSSWSVRQAIHSGQLPALSIGKRLLVPREALRTWLERGATMPLDKQDKQA